MKVEEERLVTRRVLPGIPTRLKYLVNKIETVGTLGSALAIFVMMVAGVIDIVSAQIFKAPVLMAYEVVSLSLVAAVWLAIAQGQSQERHITIRALLPKLPPGVRRVARLISHLLPLLLGVGMIWIAWSLALRSIVMRELVPSGLPVPISFARITLLVGVVIFSLTCLVQTIQSIRNLTRRKTIS